MSNASTPNEKDKNLRAGSWADEEKIKFLIQLVNSQLPKIDWKAVVPPEGRDMRACQNMVDREKRAHALQRGGGAAFSGKATDKDVTTPKVEGAETESPFGVSDVSGTVTPTPAKKKAAPRKRKSAGADGADGAGNGEGNVDADAADDAADEKPKKKRGPKPKAATAVTNAVDAAAGYAAASNNAVAAEAADETPKKKRGPKPKVKKEQVEAEGNKLPEVNSSKVKEFGGEKHESLFGPTTPAAGTNYDHAQSTQDAA